MENPFPPPDGKNYIGIDGAWYDVTSFIKKHPGGDIITQFIGKDASEVFKAYHTPTTLERRHLYKKSFFPKKEDAFINEIFQLQNDLYKEGFYKTDSNWYARKWLIIITMWFALFYGVHISADNRLCLAFLSIMLALVWQQAGFLMHDSMHSQLFKNHLLNSISGVLAGSVISGINGSWWREEHTVHHSLTATVDYNTNFIDPQMQEDVWAQNEKLFPFFRTTRFKRWLVTVQHLTFLPLCVGLGRQAILLDSHKGERRWYEWLAFGFHILWVCTLVSIIPTWPERIGFYATASVLVGVLHIQLLASHYSKPFFLKEELQKEWYRGQIQSNINIVNPKWLDWFHGGLNFHIEHHCFPRLPRNRLREVSNRLKPICRKHGVSYDEMSFSKIFITTIVHLKKMSDLFKLDA